MTRKKNNNYKLKERLIKLSDADTWDEAIVEWKILNECQADERDKEEGQKCLCGKRPITNIHYLENVNNKARIQVGIYCVKKFIDEDIVKISNAFKRIKKDTKGSLNEEAIERCYKRKLISKTEKDIYLSIRTKKKDDRSKSKREELNYKILFQQMELYNESEVRFMHKYDDIPFLNMKGGYTYEVKLIGNPYKYFSHWIKTLLGNRKVNCALEECPICKEKGGPDTRYYCRALHYDQGEISPVVIDMSPLLFKRLKDLKTIKGTLHDFPIFITRKKKDGYYDFVVEGGKETLFEEEEEQKELEANEIDLDELVKPWTIEDLEVILNPSGKTIQTAVDEELDKLLEEEDMEEEEGGNQ